MKYTSQRNRLAAIEAQLGPRHQVIRITGGLPPETEVSSSISPQPKRDTTELLQPPSKPDSETA
jgi:hypothetical protein